MSGQRRLPTITVVFVLTLALTGIVAGIAAAGPVGAEGWDSGPPRAVEFSSQLQTSDQDTEHNCERCHSVLETNVTPRDLTNEVSNMPDHEFTLKHGEHKWCLDCHAKKNRNELRLANGTTVAWTERNETRLCAGCHGPVYNDWKEHIHGKWTGSWRNATAAKTCTECHGAHHPEFEPIEPEPAPNHPPSGPSVAQAILSPGYYIGVGIIGVGIAISVIYAAFGLKND
ncbi:MAG: putative CxxxxCH...CXXCH cytochrome family protein [Halobacteriales archaeon]|jgi:predicted CxxxxCH...CXXCH cytochrome family protein